jgi:hypothetical protein
VIRLSTLPANRTTPLPSDRKSFLSQPHFLHKGTRLTFPGLLPENCKKKGDKLSLDMVEKDTLSKTAGKMRGITLVEDLQ